MSIVQRIARPLLRCGAGFLLLAFGSAVAAAPAAMLLPIREIRFEGNRVTRDRVLLRELVVAVGDPADPARIERSRQAIQDLTLFLSVTVTVEQRPQDGGVVVLFTVRERWFVYPYPLVDVNADGDLALGAQLRGNNLFGLNHTLRITAVRRTYDGDSRPDQISLTASYLAPLLVDTRWSAALAGGYLDRTVARGELSNYGEVTRYAEAQALRTLNRHGLLSQGWTIGGGLRFQHQTIDPGSDPAPPSAGTAIAVLGSARYRDIRFNNYSETGTEFGNRIEIASKGLGSDYDYQRVTSSVSQSWPLGGVPYQTFELKADVGSYFGGGEGRLRDAFTVGGAELLRGYRRDQAQGDFLYYAAAEYLRPVIWNTLRLLLVAEAGSAWPSLGSRERRPLYASIGIGLRLRIVVVVNLQFEIGVAMPLSGGGSARLFGGGGR